MGDIHVDAEECRRNKNDALPDKKDKGEEVDLYGELWHACAGHFVHVPKAGEKVFYFPQGHLEQVEACINQDCKWNMPTYNLPSKILCKVVNVQLKAEANTDEVFAQITLLPLKEPEEYSSEDKCPRLFSRRSQVRSFIKKLTPSDTSTHGGLSVPRRYADECLPPLDMSQQPPTQELVAKDINGLEWKFRHIYRGQPKRHLLTSGWSTFVTSKKVINGDALVLLRGENRELRIGIRRAMTKKSNALTPLMPGQAMQHGILASGYHAITTGTMFTVYHRPWTCPSEFIIPYGRYIKAAKMDYFVGMKIKMQFEGDEFTEDRLAGKVTGIEDIDSLNWPGSKWRCLKVKWDATVTHPDRVSPWNVDPLEFNEKNHALSQPNVKKARNLGPFPPEHSRSNRHGALQSSFDCAPQKISRVLQCQETRDMGCLDWSALESPSSLPLLNHCGHKISGNSDSQNKGIIELQGEIEGQLSPPDCCNRYMLFGVNLVNGSPELPSPQLANPSGFQHPSKFSSSKWSVCQEFQSQDQSMSNSCILCKKECWISCLLTNRSCTKVLKQGAALGRSVDLTHFNGYDEFISKLDHMFDFNGSLIVGSDGWQVTYTNDNGDLVLLTPDLPWQKLQSTVRKILICQKKDVKMQNQRSPGLTTA